MKRLIAVVLFAVSSCVFAQSSTAIITEGVVQSVQPAYGPAQPLYTIQCGSTPGSQQIVQQQAQHGTLQTIAGGVAGAVIGSRFGGGTGKIITTTAGAMAGAELARPEPRTQVIQTPGTQACIQVPAGMAPPPLIGYTIQYSYNGMLYQGVTQRAVNIGDTVRIEVGVRMVQ